MDISDAYDRYNPLLFKIAAGMGFSPQDAQDIVQDVWQKALRNTADVRDEKAWLCRLVINRCLMQVRKKTRFREKMSYLLGRAPSDMNGAEILIKVEEIKAVQHCMSQLSAESLSILTLRYQADLNATHIGEVLNMNPSTVRAKLCRARLELAQSLKAKGIDNE